jgi:hypothetical protein
MIRAAACAAVHPTTVTCAARRSATSSIAAPSTVMRTTATTAAVEATAATTTAVETAASATTAMTATTMLRERSRGAKQRHGSKCSEENLETSGPNHVYYLHPTTSPTMRAAGTPRPFYTS